MTYVRDNMVNTCLHSRAREAAKQEQNFCSDRKSIEYGWVTIGSHCHGPKCGNQADEVA